VPGTLDAEAIEIRKSHIAMVKFQKRSEDDWARERLALEEAYEVASEALRMVASAIRATKSREVNNDRRIIQEMFRTSLGTYIIN